MQCIQISQSKLAKTLFLALVGLSFGSSISAQPLTTQTAFSLQRDSESVSSSALNSEFSMSEIFQCIRHCVSDNLLCKNIMLNTSSGQCVSVSENPGNKTVVEIIKEEEFSVSLTRNENIYVYKKHIDCETTKGLELFRYGSTTACLGIFQTPVLNYTEANAACVSMGLHLVTVKTSEKLKILQSLGRDLYSFWIGCDDLAEEGKFVWKEDLQELSNDNIQLIFAPGQPDDHNNKEDCCHLSAQFDFFINDGYWGTRRAYVCEYTMKWS